MQEKRLEKLVCYLCLAHQIFMIFGAVKENWNVLVPLFILCFAVSNFFICMGKYGEYGFRCAIYTFTTMLSMTIYATKTDNLVAVLIPFLAVCVTIGICGVSKLMAIPTVFFTFVLGYHVFVTKLIKYTDFEDFYGVVIPIYNSYMLIALIYFWVVNREKTAHQIHLKIDELKKAERSKDDFMANISHELRTPINSITGMSEVILRENLEDEIRENVVNIQTSGMNLLSVVSDLLDFSELQAGEQVINEKSYNITSTINDVINMTNVWKEDKNIDFWVECNANIPSKLIGDEQKIRSVMLKILNNAVKFTVEGYVKLSIDYRKEYYGINLIITVKDTGIGIEKKELEEIFTSFNQVDAKRNRQEGGVGLGLAIAQMIVEKMGGFINVKSEFGKGSEFKVVIPQKVEDSTGIVSLDNPKRFSILAYVNLDHYARSGLRDEYLGNMEKISVQLDVPFHICKNLNEFKRRIDHYYVSHIFISIAEYKEDKEYFDGLIDKYSVVIVIDRENDSDFINKSIIRLYKPLFILPVIMILNGINMKKVSTTDYYHHDKFIAPTAKILIVDDNKINLRVATSLLKPYQIKIVTADSGPDALEKIQTKDFDLILLDHMMPEMDGIETLNRIRNKPDNYYKTIPIIALTANAVAGAREKFMDAGFQEFVAKPIEVYILERVLRDYLPQSKIEFVTTNSAETEFSVVNLPDISSENINALDVTSTTNESAIVENNMAHVNTAVTDNSTADADEDINYEQGISYCGSIEDLMEILEIHYNDGPENTTKIQEYYDVKDWKNYTILVHGLKSSMKSVGICKLSDMAKELEFAGKRGDEEYILSNHDEMMDEYNRILKMLSEKFGGEVEEEVSDIDLSTLIEVTDSEIDQLINDFEDAVYTFDPDNMLSITNKIAGCKYNEKPLASHIDVINNKIQMSDYMSALDALKKEFDKLRKA